MFSLASKLGTVTKDFEQTVSDSKSPLSSDKKEGTLTSPSGGHWSIYLQEVGFVVGLIVSIASYVMERYDLIGSGILISVLTGFAIYQLNDMRYLQTVETYIDILTKKVSDTAKQLTQITQVNTKLESDESTMQKEVTKYTEAAKTAETVLTEKIKELDSVKNELAKKEKDYEGISLKLQDVYTKINGANHQITNQLKDYSEEHKLLSDDVQTFIQTTHENDLDVKKEESEVNQLTADTNQITSTISKLDQEVDKMSGLFNLQTKLHEAALEIKVDVSKLDETGTKVSASAHSILTSTENLKASTQNEKETAKILENMDVNRLSNNVDRLIAAMEKKVTDKKTNKK